jgi:hypothetical protein
MFEILGNLKQYYARFEAFPVFETFLLYAIKDMKPRIFVDAIDQPQCLVLISPPAFFILGEPREEVAKEVFALFHHDAWVIAASASWGAWIRDAFQANVVLHKRICFASDQLDLEHIRKQRKPLPPGLSIVPIDSALACHGIVYDDVVSRFFTKSDFSTHGFGFALVDHQGIAQGFALTNYPMVPPNVELYFRVGYDSYPEYRGQGYGTSLCSYFIEAALTRGYTPIWDSANDISAHIALKLGFRIDHEWEMYHII